MLIEEDRIVTLDYDSAQLPRSVRQFQPTLYKEDESFICVLGPDLEQAVYGRGATEDEAIKAWEKDFKERLQSKGEDDSVAQYLRDTMATSKNDVW